MWKYTLTDDWDVKLDMTEDGLYVWHRSQYGMDEILRTWMIARVPQKHYWKYTPGWKSTSKYIEGM